MGSSSSTPPASMAGMTMGTKIAGGAGIVLLISTFLEWVHVDFAAGAFSAGGGASGFGEYFLGKLTALLAVGVIALVVMEVMGTSLNLPVPPALAIAGAGGLSFLFALFHVFSQPGPGIDVPGVDIGPSYGVFVALVAAAGVAYGGWRKMSE